MTRLIQPTTAEEFVLRVEDGQKADLLDGVIYRTSPDAPETADVNLFLCILLGVVEASLERGATFRSQAVPGFWLDTRWLFAGELPPPDECIEKI